MSDWLASGVSQMAGSLQGSSILAIAAQVRALVAQGHQVCNLTIGDFDPKQFPVPEALIAGTEAALRAGHTNYPPASGIPELRKAVQHMYRVRSGLALAENRILIAGGARPLRAHRGRGCSRLNPSRYKAGRNGCRPARQSRGSGRRRA